jgi:hypothetical protein
MAQIEGEIVIERGVEDVFDFVANQCNEPLYNTEMVSSERLTGGEIGLGSQFKAVMRAGKREFPLVIEFTAFDRPRRLGSHSSGAGMTTDGELTFEAVGASTLMRWSWDVRPTGAMRLLSPLVTWMGGRQETRIWTSLKQRLEA